MAQIQVFLQIAQIVLGLFPTILSAVQAVEAAIPGSGNGKAKFDAVMGSVQAVYSAVSSGLPVFAQIAPAIESVINLAVTAFNATGIFGKSSPPAA